MESQRNTRFAKVQEGRSDEIHCEVKEGQRRE